MSASVAQQEIANYKRPPRAATRRLAFLIFNAAHPEVLRAVVKLTRSILQQQRDEGRKKPRIGMRAVWEMVRYGVGCEPLVLGVKRPMLDNRLVPEYARWISERYADLATNFKLRESPGERAGEDA